MIENLMHVNLSLRFLTAFTVVAKDPLQSIEATILRALDQVNITKSSGGGYRRQKKLEKTNILGLLLLVF